MRVLEVGTGSGYQAAVLAQLGCLVVSMERHAELADAARARLEDLGLAGRVRIVVGDGSVGRPEDAPFGGIVVTAAAPRIPDALPGQLADGGRLVVPVGAPRRQELMLVVRRGDEFERQECGACVFVPLVGASGFSEDAKRAPAMARPTVRLRRRRTSARDALGCAHLETGLVVDGLDRVHHQLDTEAVVDQVVAAFGDHVGERMVGQQAGRSRSPAPHGRSAAPAGR